MTLRQLITQRIRESGPISFAEFMDFSLYHHELGYYARAVQRTGRAGDFFTSVDVGAFFGELLARQFAEMFRLANAFDLVEAGCGNGRLAKDVLDALQRDNPDIYSAIRLSLVERSPQARAAQIDILGPHVDRLHYSGPVFPERIRGIIFANELLDALPTHAVVMTDRGLREVFVDEKDGRFVEHVDEPSSPRLLEYLSRAGAGLRPGWRAEVNLAAEDWMRAAAQSLQAGFLVVIDYGHDEADLYGSSHSAGTITTFKSHTTFADSLQDPGESDMTAHVDLTNATRAAESGGAETIARLDQTYFMLGLASEELRDAAENHSPRTVQRRRALKTLMMPGGLGSTHKVLIFGKGVGKPALLGTSQGTRLT
jgi:SAM-dependent MidA family methyltransferase